MKKPIDGGPAFPQPCTENGHAANSESSVAGCGLSVRDYFAAKAMQGDWASQGSDIGVIGSSCSDENLLGLAELYYRMADAMVAARNQ